MRHSSLIARGWDAGQAAWNMKMISTTPPSPVSLGATHSDLAFTGKYVVQGNYNGFEIWDISNPAKPVLANAYECPASQNDVSVYKNLLFMSSEATASRKYGKAGAQERERSGFGNGLGIERARPEIRDARVDHGGDAARDDADFVRILHRGRQRPAVRDRPNQRSKPAVRIGRRRVAVHATGEREIGRAREREVGHQAKPFVLRNGQAERGRGKRRGACRRAGLRNGVDAKPI